MVGEITIYISLRSAVLEGYKNKYNLQHGKRILRCNHW